MRRRRWLGAALVPLLLGAVAGGAIWWRYKAQPKPVEVELEPNNSTKEANLIGNHRVVRGHIGKCLSPQESDRDYFRFTVGKVPSVLSVDVTGIPAMNLKLQVFSPSGQRLAEADDGSPGEGEHIPNVRLDEAGEYYVTVREVRVEGKPATEDDVNWYTLRAGWHALDPGEESEPDDTPAQAIPLVVGEPLRGYAGRAGDVDYYYLRGEGGGTLEASLSAIDGVDLRLVILPPGATTGPPSAMPPGTKVFDAGGPGAAEEASGIAWPAGTPGPILVVERKAEKPDNKPERRQLVGIDVPYSLTARLRP
jgi:hypothetical protein